MSVNPTFPGLAGDPPFQTATHAVGRKTQRQAQSQGSGWQQQMERAQFDNWFKPFDPGSPTLAKNTTQIPAKAQMGSAAFLSNSRLQMALIAKADVSAHDSSSKTADSVPGAAHKELPVGDLVNGSLTAHNLSAAASQEQQPPTGEPTANETIGKPKPGSQGSPATPSDAAPSAGPFIAAGGEPAPTASALASEAPDTAHVTALTAPASNALTAANATSGTVLAVLPQESTVGDLVNGSSTTHDLSGAASQKQQPPAAEPTANEAIGNPKRGSQGSPATPSDADPRARPFTAAGGGPAPTATALASDAPNTAHVTALSAPAANAVTTANATSGTVLAVVPQAMERSIALASSDLSSALNAISAMDFESIDGPPAPHRPTEMAKGAAQLKAPRAAGLTGSSNDSIRLHVQWQDQSANIWLGMDGSASRVASQVDMIVAELRRHFAALGQRVGRITCNGSLVFDGQLQHADKDEHSFAQQIEGQTRVQARVNRKVKSHPSPFSEHNNEEEI